MIEFIVMVKLICQEIKEEEYSDHLDCVMVIHKLPPYMPDPLDRPEVWSCEKRPTLCLKGEKYGT